MSTNKFIHKVMTEEQVRLDDLKLSSDPDKAGTVIAEGAIMFGGAEVISYVLENYIGPVRMVLDGDWDREKVVFPGYQDAKYAGNYAIMPDGGCYSEALIVMANEHESVTHSNWEEWAFN